MKEHVVRARIEAELKARASEVLAANGLGLSDAIRLFLRQVVLHGGLPFPVRNPHAPRVASSRRLWAMKRAAQARDHARAAQGALSAEQAMLISPEEVRGAQVKWPTAKLND